MKIKKLTDSELEIMKAIWTADEPVTIAEILTLFEERHWKKQTANTFMARLIDKGLLTVEKRVKTNYYTPLVSEREYQKFETQNMLKSIHNGSLSSFLSALLGDKTDSKDEKEVREWFARFSDDD
jgi:predicted transcriptional regulator